MGKIEGPDVYIDRCKNPFLIGSEGIMRDNLIEIAQVLIEKIKKDYDGDVSLVHVHGSYIYDDTHDLSDLDLYLVPKTARGFNLGKTFILNGIGIDYFALSWERLERIANHEEGNVSIIADGKIIYCHSEEDLEQFNRLREKAVNVIDREKYTRNGKKILESLYGDYFRIAHGGDLSETRKAAIRIINKTAFLLAEINFSYIKRGRKHQKNEILSMRNIPENFENTYEKIFAEKDNEKLKKLLYTLIRNTEKLFPKEKSETFSDTFGGFYEEMIQHYNKIYHACDSGDIYTPLYAASELASEIEELFDRCGSAYKLPDMAGVYDPDDLQKIKAAAKKHQEAFVNVLAENGLTQRTFRDIGELKKFLDTL